MTKGNTRIRWTDDERNAVLAAYRTLHAREPNRDIAKLFDRAQKALPPRRRRALDHKLRIWLESDGAHARGRPPAANVAIPSTPAGRPAVIKRTKARPQASIQTVSTLATLPASASRRRGDARGTVSAAAPDSAALAQLIVERGSEIVADILASTRVQQALRALLHAAWPTATSGAPVMVPLPRDGAAATDGDPATAALPTSGKLRVLIAGMDKREGAALAKTYDDTLELACWSTEEGLELLPVAVARADVVVGMTSLLSQPVEQTLRRHAKRYLRNARGIGGLRAELAGLALSGRGAITEAGALAHRA